LAKCKSTEFIPNCTWRLYCVLFSNTVNILCSTVSVI